MRKIFLPAAIFFPFIATELFALDGPLTPPQSLAAFKLEPGLKIELVAAEPLVISPVAVAWDEQGRMFVVEDRGYPIGPGKGQPPAGKIALLEDKDGDGKYETRTTFAEGLTFPNGVMCWRGGIYVTCAPDVFYFKDTNGDGVADVKRVVFTGFQSQSTTQLRVSHPALNIDNWIYLTCGLTAGKITSPIFPEHPMVNCNRVDFRFQPDEPVFEETAGTAQFGQTFDNFGRKFICSNRNHLQHVVLQLNYLRRNPSLAFSEVAQDIPDHGAACKVFPLSANITTAASHTGFFTSACGVTIYDGTALPEKYRGHSFTCEPAGNLIHHDVLSPSNSTFVASRAYETQEFLASPDNWFRPVNLAVGSDGALYVCDMYRKTIEHPDYLPEAQRKVTDFESGKDKGRIYRVVSSKKNSVSTRRPDLANASIKQLCAELENPNRWWRMTAQRLLMERRDKTAPLVLKSILAKTKNPVIKVQVLRTLDGFTALSEQEILTALADKSPEVREQGILLAEPILDGSPKLISRLLNMADDENPRVRFQCALTLGELQNPKVISALAKIAERDGKDRWARAAVLSSITGRAHDLLKELLPVAKKISREKTGDVSLLPFLNELGKVLGNDKTNSVLSTLHLMTSSTNDADFDWQLALLSGFADGFRSSHGNIGERSALMSAVSLDSSATPKRLGEMLKRAGEISAAENQPLERRLMAVGLLSYTDSSSSGKIWEQLLEPRQPPEIQIASIRALTQMPGTNGAALVQRERWNSYTPATREVVLAAMMSQTNLLGALLEGVERGDVPPWSINPERRNNLLKHKDELIRARATKLFQNLQAGDRLKIYEEYKSVLSLKANAASGHAVFTKTCASCHVFAGEGKAVGPDLTGIRNQPADVLLLHIIVPEFEIMPIYTTYNVETKDGQSFSGLLAAETALSFTLRQAQGLEQIIPRANIASATTSRLSLMPQELEKTMSRQDLADVIGFLKGGEPE